MVEQNIASALVLEFDADLGSSYQDANTDFAIASRLLIQLIPGGQGRLLDPSFPQPSAGQQPSNLVVGQDHVTDPTTSPYRDIDR
jgi:hypothetical protein